MSDEPLLDSLAAAFQNDGDITRRQALDDARRDGLPSLRSETWKYTSLRALEERHFTPAPTTATTIDPAWLNTIPTPRLVFINGRHSPSLSNLSGLPQGITIHPCQPPDRTRQRTTPHSPTSNIEMKHLPGSTPHSPTKEYCCVSIKTSPSTHPSTSSLLLQQVK